MKNRKKINKINSINNNLFGDNDAAGNKAYNMNDDLCSDPRYTEQITAYSDGDLKGFRRRQFEKHMKHCRKCSDAVRDSRFAVMILSGSREKFADLADELDPARTERARTALIAALRSEPSYNKAGMVRSESTVRSPGFRKMIYRVSALAAGVVVITGVIGVIRILSDDPGMQNYQSTKEEDSRYVMSSDTPAGNMISDAFNDKAGAEMDDKEALQTDSIYEAVAYYEIDEPDKPYILLLIFKRDVISKYYDDFIQTYRDSGTDASVEIISGDNTQKLVEYTGTQKAEEISDAAVDNDADILVISIGR